jgi:hypothetical protein
MRFLEFIIFNSFFNIYFFVKICWFWIIEALSTTFWNYFTFDSFYFYLLSIFNFLLGIGYFLLNCLYECQATYLDYLTRIKAFIKFIYYEWQRPVNSPFDWTPVWVCFPGYDKLDIFAQIREFFQYNFNVVCIGLEYVIYFISTNCLILFNLFSNQEFIPAMSMFQSRFFLPDHGFWTFTLKFWFIVGLFLLPHYIVNSSMDIDYINIYLPTKIQNFYFKDIEMYSAKKKTIWTFNTRVKFANISKVAPLPTKDYLLNIRHNLFLLQKIQQLFLLKLNKLNLNFSLFKPLRKSQNLVFWINLDLEVFTQHTRKVAVNHYFKFLSKQFSKILPFFGSFTMIPIFWNFYSFKKSWQYVSRYIVNLSLFDLSRLFYLFTKINIFCNFLAKFPKFHLVKSFCVMFLKWNLFITFYFFYCFKKLTFIHKIILLILNSSFFLFLITFGHSLIYCLNKVSLFLYFILIWSGRVMQIFFQKQLWSLRNKYYVYQAEKLKRFKEFYKFLLQKDSLYYILTLFSLNFCKFYNSINHTYFPYTYKDLTLILLHNRQQYAELTTLLNIYLDLEQKLLFKYKKLFKTTQIYKPFTIFNRKIAISPIDKDRPDFRVDLTSGGSNNLRFGYGFEGTSNFFYSDYESYELLIEFLDVDSNSDYIQAMHPIPFERLGYNEKFPSALELEYDLDDDLEESGINMKEWRHEDFLGEYYNNERLEFNIPLPDYYDRIFIQERYSYIEHIFPFVKLTRDFFEKNRDSWYDSNNWEVLLTLELEDFRNFHEFSKLLYTKSLHYYRYDAADLMFYSEDLFFDDDEFLDWISNLLDEAAIWAPAPLPNEQGTWWTEEPLFFLDKYRAVYSQVAPLRHNFSMNSFFAAFDYEYQSFFNIKDFYLEYDDWYELGMDHLPFWITSWFLATGFIMIVPMDLIYKFFVYGSTQLRLENVFVTYLGFGIPSQSLISSYPVSYNILNVIDSAFRLAIFQTPIDILSYGFDNNYLQAVFVRISSYSIDDFWKLCKSQYPIIEYLVVGPAAVKKSWLFFFDVIYLRPIMHGVETLSVSTIFLDKAYDLCTDQFLYQYIFNSFSDYRWISFGFLKYDYFFYNLMSYTIDMTLFEAKYWLEGAYSFFNLSNYYDFK